MSPMSPRLLRPLASGVHPEAANWRSRVVANGGSVSASTLTAVSKFCAAIDSAGIRSSFLRLNLFCGTGLSAALVPLYRGASRTGTQLGNATDTNSNFVNGDYVETGSTGGLIGNTSSKALSTGLNVNDTSDTRHLSVWQVTAGNVTNGTLVGADNFNDSGFYLNAIDISGADSTRMRHRAFSTDDFGPQAGSNAASRHFVAIATASGGAAIFYSNGSQVSTITTNARTRTAPPYYVFALNRKNIANSWVNARLGAYSIGDNLTQAQVSSYYTAMQAFQIAMGRAA